MSFLKNANPVGAFSDFRAVYRDAGPRRWPIMVVSLLTTVGIFSIMAGESWTMPRALPTITYINSWPADRTEEETRAFIAENQARKEERAALEQAASEEGKKVWKTLGKVSGIDVAKVEAEAEADRKAAAAAEKARLEQMTGQNLPEPDAPQALPEPPVEP
ncbi:hypothetical protein [Novosphingobium sp.]|uniref:hypothetical protein n=1 Tax=Novosphingobium sp. TaxID=1874826 RepID=UPI002733DD6E|nr:hypothetical protein [Novosphingobium sp.]MDP3905583.1 hypothetical protein [Novosphingobium sp.]